MKLGSKERGRRFFAREQVDRPPMNYFSNPGVDGRLKERLGLAPDDAEGLREALGIDFRAVAPPYKGPPLHDAPPDRRVDEWGVRRRWVANEFGGYWDYVDFPLENADPETAARWPMPSPDDFDVEAVVARARAWAGACVILGSAGMADVMNSAGMIMGVERVMVGMATEDPTFVVYTDRRIEVQLGALERALDAARGLVDALWIGEDLGSQRGPLISLDLYRRFLRPRQQRFVDLAKAHGLPVMIHSCGSSRWAFEDFIEMGIDAVDTLQPEAAGMAPASLKRDFGGRLAFHGCLSTAGPLATADADAVRRHCRDLLEVMAPGGGYAFAPTHQIQDNTPVDNILAAYATARDWRDGAAKG